MTTHRSSLPRAALAAAILIAAAAVVSGARRPVGLSGTEVTVPWKAFDSLSSRPRDTVFVKPTHKPPVPIVLDAARLTLTLNDSSAICDMRLDYTVLCDEGWCTVPFAGNARKLRLVDVKTPRGDFLRLDNSQCDLVARGGTKNRQRALTCRSAPSAENTGGRRTVSVYVPAATRVLLDIIHPSNFQVADIDKAQALSRKTVRGRTHTTCALEARGSWVTVAYVPPVRVVDADTTDETPVAVEKRPPRLSVVHETAVFVTDASRIAVHAVHVTVTHAPVRELAMVLPQGFSLLKVTGNGMGRWVLKDSLLTLPLRFELEGAYTFALTAELPQDSLVTIPTPRLVDAARESGRFALAVAGAAEAHPVAMHNCLSAPRQAFTDQLSPQFTEVVRQASRDTRDILTAGVYHALPCRAAFRLVRHEPVPVADAVADSGLLLTAISEERKVVTHAFFRLHQRGRQFLTLHLPDSSELWLVKLGGRELVPFRDDSGSLKVPLSRYLGENSAEEAVNLEVVMFENRAGHGPLELACLVPDIPVTSLSWSVFYPGVWALRRVEGDFETSHGPVGMPARVQVDDALVRGQYRRLSKWASEQQQRGPNGSHLMVMPTDPRHLVARRMLVVDERPRLVLHIMPSALRGWLTALLVIAMLASLVVPFVHRRRS